MSEYTVTVWGTKVEVSVYQKSKSVWVATGTYHDEHIEVTNRSASSALSLWRKTATYRGN